jgi:hypothetical protein
MTMQTVTRSSHRPPDSSSGRFKHCRGKLAIAVAAALAFGAITGAALTTQLTKPAVSVIKNHLQPLPNELGTPLVGDRDDCAGPNYPARPC